MSTLSRVVIVTSEYPPEPTVSGRMAADLAVHLKELGSAVTVIAPYASRGVASPINGRSAGYPAPRKIILEEISLVPVIRVPSYLAPESRFPTRMRESWSFGRWSARLLRQHPRPDVIYSATWPMLGQAWITAAAARLGIAHVTHVMDLYPESALLKIPVFAQVMTRAPLLALDRWIAHRVSSLAVISPHMRDVYLRSRGVDPSRLAIIPTWQDDSAYSRLPNKTEACAKYSIPSGPFTFLYLGNIGPVAGVEHLIESFAKAGLQDARLIVVGAGSNKKSCVELASRTRASVLFISEPDVANVPWLQSLADVCLLPVRAGTAASSVPSKLSAYMLSAKPILASVDSASESARLVTEANCGWVVEPDNVPVLAEKLGAASHTPAHRLHQMGKSGRAFALQHLSKSRGVQRLADLLAAAAAPRASAVTSVNSTPQTVEISP